MKLSFLKVCASVALCVAGSAHAVTYVYVGSWHVGDGPVWTSNPTVYSGQEAAAFLFGGSASAYAISTVDANPLNINNMSFVDGWADTTYMSPNAPASQSFSVDSGPPGYNDPVGGPAFSAFVLDHSCAYRYSDPSLTCGSEDLNVNYAFLPVPEPGTWAMMLGGLAITGLALQRRRKLGTDAA